MCTAEARWSDRTGRPITSGESLEEGNELGLRRDKRNKGFPNWINPEVEALKSQRANQNEIGSLSAEHYGRSDFIVQKHFG